MEVAMLKTMADPLVHQGEHMSKNTSGSALENKARRLIDAITANAAGKAMVLGGVTMTPDQAIAKLQAIIILLKAATDARVASTVAVRAVRSERPGAAQFVLDIQDWARVMFGTDDKALSAFGLKKKKAPKPRTAEEQTLVNQKSAATRKARHTLGPREKKAIHGAPVAPAPAATAEAANKPPGN
jgi:hypothetical protein